MFSLKNIVHNPSLHPIAARWAAPGELFVRSDKYWKGFIWINREH